MKFKVFFFFFLFFAHISFAQDDLKTIYENIYQEVNLNSEAYERLKYSTETLGHRLTGSQNGNRAEEYVFELLKSYGLEVRFQPFNAQSWQRESLTLRFNNETIDAVSLAHSPILADLNGELVDLGNGLEVDYKRIGAGIKGKIALVFLHILPNSNNDLKNLHRSEKTALAIRYGAKGIIFINSVKDNVLLTGTASITGQLIEIPAICIGLEEGMKWKELLKSKPVSAEIHMRNKAEETAARNIIIHIRGAELPQERIVIGGHLDSWDLATGAIDNGLGSFAIIDMARTFGKLNLKSKRSIDFILFMGEEQGLLGSKAYVNQAIESGEINEIKYMLNFDMVNAPIGFSSSRSEMGPLMDTWGKIYAQIDRDFENINTIDVGLHSDHQPFMLKGIPTGTARGGKLPNNAGMYYHSNKDLINLVDPAGLKQTIRVGLAYLYSLANQKDLPIQRQNEEEIVKFLESYGLKEPLVISGDWRWGKHD